MTFAKLATDFSYWQKQSARHPLFPDLTWNIPEQKSGRVTVIGGNSQNFSTVIRTAEYLGTAFPLSSVHTILPDVIRPKLPPLSNFKFTPSTDSGSFARSGALRAYFDVADANLIIGDLSKNSATAIAITDLLSHETPNNSSSPTPSTPFKPTVLTRDTVDLIANDGPIWLIRPAIFIVASMLQLQKLFRAVYYPRMILLSQPLLPVIETLHKFTLTYPTTLLTFHQDHIIVAHQGNITTTPITDTEYSPISLWSGQLASKVLGFNLYNPGQPLAATTAAILYQLS